MRRAATAQTRRPRRGAIPPPLPVPVLETPPPDRNVLDYQQELLERDARVAVHDALKATQPIDIRLRGAALVLRRPVGEVAAEVTTPAGTRTVVRLSFDGD